MTTTLRRLLSRDVDPAQLKHDAERAAVVRAHQTDPDVIAYTVATTRAALDRVMWVGIIAGLAWTASTVQQAYAAGTTPGSQAWITGWLTTAPVEIPLVAILLGEQHAARHDVRPGTWLRGARLGLLAIMLVQNVWHPAAELARAPGADTAGQLVLHVLIPVAIVLASEAITDLRETLGRAIEAAAQQAAAQAAARSAGRRAPTRHRAPDAPGPADPPLDPEAPTNSGTVRERGVRWTLDHWPAGEDAPAPRDIRAGLQRDQDLTVSTGESSKIRTAAIERRLSGADTTTSTSNSRDADPEEASTG